MRDPQDDKHVYVLGISQYRSSDGGKTFKGDAGKGVHADGHALWVNPKDGRHLIIGTDGGTYVSYDRADNWDHLNHLALGQFYHVAVNTKRPYWVFGGLQDNGCWGGPTISLKGGVGTINEDWVNIFGGDGYVCRCDPTDPDLIYFEMKAAWDASPQTGEMTGSAEESARQGWERRRQFLRIRSTGTRPHSAESQSQDLLRRRCCLQTLDAAITQNRLAAVVAEQAATATAIAESPKN